MNDSVRRWPRVVAAILTSLASGLLFTWSYYREPLLSLFPTWSQSDLSMIFSIHNMVVSATMFLTGFVMRKVSSRKIFIFSAVMVLLGLGGFQFLPTDNPAAAKVMATVLYGVVAPLGCATCAIAQFAVYGQWFPERAGLIGGLMLMCYGACAFVMGSLASVLIPVMGILSSMAITGVIGCLLIVSSIILGTPPGPEVKLPPAPPRKENAVMQDYTTGQMLKSPAFWLLYLYGVALFSTGLIFSDHAADIARYFGTAALFGLLFSPANGLSSVFAGWIVDKLSVAKTMMLFAGTLLIAGIMLLYGSRIGSSTVILIGLILGGISFGGSSSVRLSATRFFFGNKYYAQNYSVATSSIFFSSLVCMATGFIAERIPGYRGVFYIALGAAVVAWIAIVYLVIYTKKKENESNNK